MIYVGWGYVVIYIGCFGMECSWIFDIVVYESLGYFLDIFKNY